MGIDIYANWKGQTRAEEEAESTEFATLHGRVGYLREAYHGEPYATRYLVREAFEAEHGCALIPAKILKARLPETLALADERERKIYGSTDPIEIESVLRSYIDFVVLCEKKERETGEPLLIRASY